MLGAQMQGGNSSSYGTTTRQVQPFLYPTEDALVKSLSDMMLGANNPTIQNIQTAGANSINQGYSNMTKTLTSKLSGLGFGSSGKLGSAIYNTEGSRLNSLSDLFSKTAGLGLQQQQTGSSLAEALLAMTMGSTSNQKSNGMSVGEGLTV